MNASPAILLHGLGHDPAQGMATFAPVLPTDMTVTAMAGPLTFGDGPGRAWFGVDFTDNGPVADVAQAAASRDAVIAAAANAGHPVLLLGFGQGGVVALAALLARPELFRTCVVAGARVLMELLPDAPPVEAHRGKPTFWAHGRADPAIPFVSAEAGRARLKDYSVALESFDHEGGHELPSAAAVAAREWIRSHSG